MISSIFTFFFFDRACINFSLLRKHKFYIMDEGLLSKARILFNPYNVINNVVSIFCYQVGRHIPLPLYMGDWICVNPLHSSRTPWIIEATAEGGGEEPARAFTTTCESPSNTIAVQPRHKANRILALNAFDSASSGPIGASSFLHKAATTFPKLSQIKPQSPLILYPWKWLHQHSLCIIPVEEETNTLARQQSWNAHHPHYPQGTQPSAALP